MVAHLAQELQAVAVVEVAVAAFLQHLHHPLELRTRLLQAHQHLVLVLNRLALVRCEDRLGRPEGLAPGAEDRRGDDDWSGRVAVADGEEEADDGAREAALAH